MTIARTLPDLEALAIQYLLAETEVTDLFGQRVAGRKEGTLPAARISRVGGGTVVDRHLDAGLIQIEVWDDDELGAWTGCELLRAHLLDPAFRGLHAGRGVVTAVEDVAGPQEAYDDSIETPRYLARVRILAHPIPAA